MKKCRRRRRRASNNCSSHGRKCGCRHHHHSSNNCSSANVKKCCRHHHGSNSCSSANGRNGSRVAGTSTIVAPTRTIVRNVVRRRVVRVIRPIRIVTCIRTCPVYRNVYRYSRRNVFVN